MRLLEGSRHSLKDDSPQQRLPSLSEEPFAQQAPGELASRHDPYLISARARPVDPYAAWLAQREADRCLLAESGLAQSPSPRSHKQPTNTPWYVVLAGGCPDS
jgi:hypothetical protein